MTKCFCSQVGISLNNEVLDHEFGPVVWIVFGVPVRQDVMEFHVQPQNYFFSSSVNYTQK